MNFASDKGQRRSGCAERASLNTREGQNEVDGGKKATTALTARVAGHVGSRRWACGLQQQHGVTESMDQVETVMIAPDNWINKDKIHRC